MDPECEKPRLSQALTRGVEYTGLEPGHCLWQPQALPLHPTLGDDLLEMVLSLLENNMVEKYEIKKKRILKVLNSD